MTIKGKIRTSYTLLIYVYVFHTWCFVFMIDHDHLKAFVFTVQLRYHRFSSLSKQHFFEILPL